MKTDKILSRTLRAACFGAVAALITLASGAPEAAAQATRPPAALIGVVDTELLLRDSLAAQGVRLARDKYANNYQAQVKELESQLRTQDQELAQQRSVLSPEVFQQRAQEFQQKLAEFEAQVRDKQERLDFSFQQSMQEIGNTIMVVSGEVAQERGVNAVMARGQLMIFDPGMDITQPVLEKLNQRLPEVTFQDPDTLQRGAGAEGAAPAPAAP